MAFWHDVAVVHERLPAKFSSCCVTNAEIVCTLFPAVSTSIQLTNTTARITSGQKVRWENTTTWVCRRNGRRRSGEFSNGSAWNRNRRRCHRSRRDWSGRSFWKWSRCNWGRRSFWSRRRCHRSRRSFCNRSRRDWSHCYWSRRSSHHWGASNWSFRLHDRGCCYRGHSDWSRVHRGDGNRSRGSRGFWNGCRRRSSNGSSRNRCISGHDRGR
mmetsp:Transcript_32410/g.53602  ORF Transcript_32410/g.53602 Transcript_32410/m.53602 type:complete len:213 (+) Transcript_32410:584-1222(+)